MNSEDAKQLLQDHIKYMKESGEEVSDSDIEDIIPELADGMVDVYNYNLLQWLAEDYHNGYLINEYVEEYGIESKDFDIFKILMGVQQMEGERILREVWEEIREEHVTD